MFLLAYLAILSGSLDLTRLRPNINSLQCLDKSTILLTLDRNETEIVKLDIRSHEITKLGVEIGADDTDVKYANKAIFFLGDHDLLYRVNLTKPKVKIKIASEVDSFDISLDGKQVAYAGFTEGHSFIATKDLATGKVTSVRLRLAASGVHFDQSIKRVAFVQYLSKVQSQLSVYDIARKQVSSSPMQDSILQEPIFLTGSNTLAAVLVRKGWEIWSLKMPFKLDKKIAGWGERKITLFDGIAGVGYACVIEDHRLIWIDAKTGKSEEIPLPFERQS